MMKKTKTSMPEIIPLLSGKELLYKPEITYSIYSIKNLVSCPNKIYRRLYITALYHLAEFCQAMPYSEKEFNGNYGFLIRQLNLALAALKLRRGVFFPKNAGAEAIAAEEAQWTYAIFSGSLVKNLYQLQENREVGRYQLQGDLIGMWSPLVESLYRKSFYYSMRFVLPKSLKKRDIFMAALSQHIFPSLAISWLSANTYLFNLWWDVVLHQAAADNDIETIIQLAAEKMEISL
jgi:hypothetical protein